MRFSGNYVSAALLVSLTLASRARADASGLVPEVGYNYGDVETARSAAMGGALRALGNGVTGLYLNPANMALTRVYHLMALAQIWPEARRQTYGAAAVDSVTGRLAGGAGGNYGVLDPEGVDRKWTDARIAIAFPLSDRFYAGLTGKYLKLRENGYPRTGFGLPPSPFTAAGLAQDPIVDGFSFDAGLTVKPADALFIGLLGSNLTNAGNGFRPLSLGGGIGYGTSDITAEGDILADFTTFTDAAGSSRTTLRAMLGFEYLAGDHYPLRLGYRYDQGQSSHALSGGIGYVDPQFSADIAIRRTVGSKDPYGPVTTFVIDLQYFIESTGITRSPGEVVE